MAKQTPIAEIRHLLHRRRATQRHAREMLRTAPSREGAVPGGLRVVTFNLQNGKPREGYPVVEGLLWGNGSAAQDYQNQMFAALQRAGEEIKALHPDILLAQEVDKDQWRSGYLHQAEVLAYLTGLPYFRMAAAFSGPIYGIRRRPRVSTIPNTRGYGVMIASRFPARAWRVQRLGRAWPRLIWRSDPWPGLGMGLTRGIQELHENKLRARIQLGENRVLLAGELRTPYGKVSVGCTHLELHAPTAASQLRRSWRLVTELPADSCLLGGDFNLSPEEAAEAVGVLGGARVPGLHASTASFPAWRPHLNLDQLMGCGWELVGEPRAQRLSISDHLAVSFDIRPSAEGCRK